MALDADIPAGGVHSIIQADRRTRASSFLLRLARRRLNAALGLMIAAVPHVAFTADIPASAEWPEPPGFKLAELIRFVLGKEGLTVSEQGIYRDIGWSFTAQLDGKSLEVYFAQAPEPTWLLAIAPLGQPSVLGRLLGRKSDVMGPQVRAVAGLVHSVVLSLTSVAGVRWCLNGHPADCPSVNEPSLLPWPHEP